MRRATSPGTLFSTPPSMSICPSVSTGVKTPGTAIVARTASHTGPVASTTSRRASWSTATTATGRRRSAKVQPRGSFEIVHVAGLNSPLRRSEASVRKSIRRDVMRSAWPRVVRRGLPHTGRRSGCPCWCPRGGRQIPWTQHLEHADAPTRAHRLPKCCPTVPNVADLARWITSTAADLADHPVHRREPQPVASARRKERSKMRSRVSSTSPRRCLARAPRHITWRQIAVPRPPLRQDDVLRPNVRVLWRPSPARRWRQLPGALAEAVPRCVFHVIGQFEPARPLSHSPRASRVPEDQPFVHRAQAEELPPGTPAAADHRSTPPAL